MWAYYRFYREKRSDWPEIYTDAELYFCPQVKMRLFPTDEAHSNIAFTGFYEWGLSRKISRLAKEGGVLVDVGANYGYYSLLWAGKNRRNKVFAFEASPVNYPAIRQNIEQNGFCSQIDLRGVAVGRESGLLKFSPGPQGETGWGGFSLDSSGNGAEIPVQTLDNLLPQDLAIDVLKIDVEGADTWVLQGATRLLKDQRVRNIFFEQNKPRMRQLGIGEGNADEHLTRCGYGIEAMSDPVKDLVEYRAWPKRAAESF
jgi:FkbM family methyltransferase